jgi:hypothetical protein
MEIIKSNSMKRVFLIASITLVFNIANAQKIYSVDAEYKADVKVYVVDAEYKADLKIYFVDAEYKAGWKNASKKSLIY